MRHIVAISLLLIPSFSTVGWADEAHDKAAAAIQETGGSVRKMSSEDERVEVDFHLLGAKAKDGDLAPITDLKGVYRVHLGGTPITDAGLVHLKGLGEIEALHLERTKVTDAGLDIVAGLKTLKYLNLWGTAVSDEGLKKLEGLPNLEQLYLWQTKATEKGAEELQAKLPNLMIDTGWELADFNLPPPQSPKQAEAEEEDEDDM